MSGFSMSSEETSVSGLEFSTASTSTTRVRSSPWVWQFFPTVFFKHRLAEIQVALPQGKPSVALQMGLTVFDPAESGLVEVALQIELPFDVELGEILLCFSEDLLNYLSCRFERFAIVRDHFRWHASSSHVVPEAPDKGGGSHVSDQIEVYSPGCAAHIQAHPHLRGPCCIRRSHVERTGKVDSSGLKRSRLSNTMLW